jgi:hypothetical protein
MFLPDYNSVYKFLDNILSYCSKIDDVKATILMILHYPPMYLKTFKLLFGKINFVWWLCLIILLIIIILNIQYNGCIFIKMERKYMKCKEWFGPYNLPVKLGLLRKEDILPFFYIIQVLIFIIIVYRIINHFFLNN